MLSFLSFIVRAGENPKLPCESPGDADDCAVPLSALNQLFENILGVVLEIAAVVLFIMLLVGGFKYITAGGNPKMLESAKHTITYAIVGLVVAAGAFLVIEFIEQLTGANIRTFDVVVP